MEKTVLGLLAGLAVGRKDQDSLTSGGQAYSKVHHQRRRPYREPRQVIQEYASRVKRTVGAGPGNPWQFYQMSEKIRWGRMRGLHR